MLLLPGSSAIALLLLTTTHAFTLHTNPIHLTPTFQTTASTHPHPPSKPNQRGTHHRSSLADSGWKNDNFLDALGSTASPAASASEPNYDALETVTAQYNRESEGRAAFRQRQFKMMMNEDGEDTAGGGGNLDPAYGGTVDGMPESPPKIVPVEEENQGGEMFRKMMEKAEMAKAGAGPGRATAVPVVDPNLAQQQQPPVAVAAGIDPQVAYYQLQLQAWQQQMATYAQFIAANPEAAATMTMPPPPPPPMTTAIAPPQATIAAPPPPLQTTTTTTEADEKEARDYLPPNPNRNNDAYEITNSADVYLAQLKRDTAVRNWARQDGETEKSNKPFADVGVQAIGGLLSDDLVQKRREQRLNEEDYGVDAEQKRMIEGLQAEDNRRMEESEERDRLIIERGESGISSLSYKERLEQAKRKREGSPPPQQPPVAVAPVTIADPVELVAPPLQQPAVTVSPVTIADPVSRVAPPPPQQPAVTVSPVTISDPVSPVAPPPPPPQPAVTVSPVTIADPVSPVAPPPPQQPAATVSPVTILEDLIPATTTPTPPSSFPDMETPDTEEGTPQQPNFALPVKDESSIAPVSAPSSIDSDDTRKSLRTLMGYLLKHRGGPGFGSGRLKSNDAGKLEDALGEVLGMLRAEAGVEVEVEDATIEVEDVGVPSSSSSSSSSSSPRLDEGVLACVKGAVSAYENTQQEALLMPLRNALLSAASAINTVIAEGEVENARHYEAVVDTAPLSPPSTTPQQAQAAQAVAPVAVPVEREEKKVIETRDEVPFEQPAAKDIDSTTPVSNTARLQDAYDTLKASEGGGKFGLKKGISGSEISHVSEVLSDMRTLIMEELDTGIPEPRVSQTVESGSTATPTTSAPSGEERAGVVAGATTTSTTTPITGGSSKYEQMLAKAKAEEAAR